MSRTFGYADTAHAIGTAYLTGGDPIRGIVALDKIEPGHRDAAIWSDVAAAKWSLAERNGQPHQLLEAIEASMRALALKRDLPSAWFNRAAAADSLGLAPVAHAAWQEYLSLDPDSKWSAIVRERLANSARTDADAWNRATARLDRLSNAELARLAVRFPQQSRTYAEGPFLASWAEAIAAGQIIEAENHLSRARTVGEALRVSRGESMVLDAVNAIDHAESKNTLAALSNGHLAYRTGRLAYRDNDLVVAKQHFVKATKLLRHGKSPMSTIAEFYVASVLFNENRVLEALDVLTPALMAARKVRGHKALVAQILWEVALCEAVRGHWSDSMAAAKESLEIYKHLGERGNAAATEAILSEDYDLLGHREEAWRHGASALRAACLAGDVFRARVILAALCRTELRAKRWQNAGTLVTLEGELAIRQDGKIDTDMHLRDAAVQFHLGNARDAQRALDRARAAAGSMPNRSSQDKLLADVDAVAGSIFRHSDPHRAIRDLSSAIAFQEKATRPIVLPELLLERGRANLALDRGDAAARDFESGIRELERERSHVSETELRPGIFDDAADLFDEMISLQIRSGVSAQDVLSTVERGRARAVLEQIQENVESSWRTPTIAEIQDQLGPTAVFVEFVTLPDRLAIFVIRRNSFFLQTEMTPRSALHEAARELTDSLAANAPPANTRARGVTLYDLLIAPVEAHLTGATSVIIVPDAVLQRVPFAALYDGNRNSYLVERWSSTTHPSAGTFIATEQWLRRFRGTSMRTAVVFANPTVPRNEYPDLPSLAGSKREARVAARYKKSAVYLNDYATAQRFQEAAASYDVVHFAGHAVIETREPGSSALIFASSPGRHGALTLRAIAKMRFRSTRVVVLAACSTLTGRNAAIEGVPSLARAFLVARVPAVIGTLWDIPDSEAAPLMDALHRELARGTLPTNALRTAQLEALRSGNPARRQPAHWAAFSQTGS